MICVECTVVDAAQNITVHESLKYSEVQNRQVQHLKCTMVKVQSRSTPTHLLRSHDLSYHDLYTKASYIRHEDYFRPSSVTLRGPPQDSASGWTGELWSKTKGSHQKKKRINYGFLP